MTWQQTLVSHESHCIPNGSQGCARDQVRCTSCICKLMTIKRVAAQRWMSCWNVTAICRASPLFQLTCCWRWRLTSSKSRAELPAARAHLTCCKPSNLLRSSACKCWLSSGASWALVHHGICGGGLSRCFVRHLTSQTVLVTLGSVRMCIWLLSGAMETAASPREVRCIAHEVLTLTAGTEIEGAKWLY